LGPEKKFFNQVIVMMCKLLLWFAVAALIVIVIVSCCTGKKEHMMPFPLVGGNAFEYLPQQMPVFDAPDPLRVREASGPAEFSGPLVTIPGSYGKAFDPEWPEEQASWTGIQEPVAGTYYSARDGALVV
jgi:hypothetical protein